MQDFQLFVFRTANVTVSSEFVVSMFNDTHSNTFHIDGKDDEYKEIARDHGYENWRQYAIEHELTHHFLADLMGWPHSFSLYENPPLGEWPQRVADEEHLVNSLQKYHRLKVKDSYGVLEWKFGEHLDEVVGRLKSVLDTLGERYYALG